MDVIKLLFLWPPLKWSEVKVIQSCPALCDSVDWTAHRFLQARILEWVAFSFSMGSSQPRDQTPRSPALQADLYQLSHQRSPRVLEWQAYRFSRGSSQPRNWTGVSCIAGGFFTNWATKGSFENEIYCRIFTLLTLSKLSFWNTLYSLRFILLIIKGKLFYKSHWKKECLIICYFLCELVNQNFLKISISIWNNINRWEEELRDCKKYRQWQITYYLILIFS